MKKPMKFILITVILLFIVYLSVCIHISFKTNKITKESYDSYGNNNVYSEIISDELFGQLNYRRHENEFDDHTVETNEKTFPLTFWFGKKANSNYRYTYERKNDNDRSLCGSSKVSVTVVWKFKNWKWIICEVHENP